MSSRNRPYWILARRFVWFLFVLFKNRSWRFKRLWGCQFNNIGPGSAVMTTLLKNKAGLVTYERTILERDVNDVLFECVLLTNVETSCWTIQNVERSEVLVHTNDILQYL